MKLTTTVIIISILTLGLSSAFAGEVLRLKAGNMRVENFIGVRNYFASTSTADGKNYFVIQFKKAITEETKATLAQMGIESKGYLPEDALIVRASLADVQAAAFMSDVNGVIPFQAEWKISSELFSLPDDRAETIYVTSLDSSDTLAIARKMKAAGIHVRNVETDAIVAQATREQIPAIAELEGVEWIQAFPFFVTFDYDMSAETSETPTPPAPPVMPAIKGYESGTKVMNMDAAWDRGLQGEGQIVAMADTGVDTGDIATLHPDLKAVFKGYALGIGAKSFEDPNGHGTHVCGSVVGNGALSNGGIRGGAFAAKMAPAGIWSPLANNIGFNTDFNNFVGKPYADGARIHTNSWGSAQNPGAYDSFAVKADTYLWNNQDILVLFAAGNDGKDINKDGRIDEGSLASPATAKNVLTVGASENLLAEGGIQRPLSQLRDGDKKWGVEPLKSDTLSNNPDGLAAFSSRGPTQDGRIKPDVVAPGTNIVSTRSRHPKAGMLWGEFGPNYLYAGGTSMATPLTAGAAVLAREYLVKNKQIANPSAALVKGALIHSAKDLFPGQYGRGAGQELPTARPNAHEGYGRVDMDKATHLENTQIVDNTMGVAVNEEATVTIDLAQGQSLRATIVYTDAPGTALAAKALVNDIDLQIVSPDRSVKQLADRTNNVEMVEMQNLSAGQYQVVVKGINVPQGKSGKQPYALLITQY